MSWAKESAEKRKEKPQISPLRYAPVEMTSLWVGHGPIPMENRLPLRNKFVISTGAYPDFLPRSTGQGHVCAFL
jgi:hypothetical protein